MDFYLGQIIMVGFNFANRNFAECNGQLLAISQNSALFSLLGTIYGGDGRTTFALPDFQGRYPMGQGNGAGLSSRVQGQKFGVETVTLNVLNLPAHNHSLQISTSAADTQTPAGTLLGQTSEDTYRSSAGTTSIANSAAISTEGANQAFDILPPTQVVRFLICTQGLFPSRN